MVGACIPWKSASPMVSVRPPEGWQFTLHLYSSRVTEPKCPHRSPSGPKSGASGRVSEGGDEPGNDHGCPGRLSYRGQGQRTRQGRPWYSTEGQSPDRMDPASALHAVVYGGLAVL